MRVKIKKYWLITFDVLIATSLTYFSITLDSWWMGGWAIALWLLTINTVLIQRMKEE